MIPSLLVGGRTFPIMYPSQIASLLSLPGPMSREQLEAKFFECAELAISVEQARRAADIIWNLEKLERVGNFIEFYRDNSLGRDGAQGLS